jgi:hypothetical protein
LSLSQLSRLGKEILSMHKSDQFFNLFKVVFRGREDVVPRFWQSSNQRKGYAPICRNEGRPTLCRRPCHGCPNKDYQPLDDKLLIDHLKGDHILGVYPLLTDNCCWFVALDFDNHNGQREPRGDVSKFYAVCQTHEIPCYVLRSKSGAGYHCYIFFSQAVPAWKPRRVAVALLEKAQIIGNNSSFDRLFPSQDELSDHIPLGNLISLPFQGEAKLAGHTLFLDPTSELAAPYSDQIQVLKTIRKISEADLDQIIETWELEGKAPLSVKSEKAGQASCSPGKFPKGERNVSLTSIAGSLRRQGQDHPDILASLLATNARQCEPPLPEAEVGQIASSVSRYPTDGSNIRRLEAARELVAQLPEAITSDPGAAFQEETLAALKVIRAADPVTWARLRKVLMKHVSWNDLMAAMDKIEKSPQKPPLYDSVGPYRTEGGVFSLVRQTQEGEALVPLTNFTARIVREKVYDDGLEQTAFFAIEGQLQDGTPLSNIDIPADRFAPMTWVTAKWGSRPVLHAGQGTKDHVRTAIQMLSSEAVRQVVFSHLGWRRVEGQWLYLHCGGGIGMDGLARDICVSPGDGRINSFALPSPPDQIQAAAAIRASLDIMRVAPPPVAVSLLSGVYRSVLAEVLPVDFSLFLAGRTGAQKSELSALAQAHFGADFNGKNLPGNWYGTANSLEKMAFLAKDAVFTVDDFVPNGSFKNVMDMHGKADRLLRGQGNRSGRPRMKPDGSLRQEYFPRGLILASGEDTPKGHSLRSRMLILEVSPGEVDLELLTRLQAAARDGLFAQAMSAYLQWLAPRLDNLRASLLKDQQGLRDQARQELDNAHGRTPDIIASLFLGWGKFISFASDLGVIPDEEVGLIQAGWQALVAAGNSQSEQQDTEDVVSRFLNLLSAGLSSGCAHLAEARTNGSPTDAPSWGWRQKGTAPNEYLPQGPCLGWIDGDDIFLNPEAAFGAVQELARKQGGNLPVTANTLWRRLAEREILASTETGRTTVRRQIATKRHYVLHLKKATLGWQAI